MISLVHINELLEPKATRACQNYTSHKLNSGFDIDAHSLSLYFHSQFPILHPHSHRSNNKTFNLRLNTILAVDFVFGFFFHDKHILTLTGRHFGHIDIILDSYYWIQTSRHIDLVRKNMPFCARSCVYYFNFILEHFGCETSVWVVFIICIRNVFFRHLYFILFSLYSMVFLNFKQLE